MAKKPTSVRPNQTTQSPDCFSAPYLICLLEEIKLMLGQARKAGSPGNTDRAIVDIHSHVSTSVNHFLDQAVSGDTKGMLVMGKLWGIEAGHPMKPAGAAHALLMSVDDVLKTKTKCLTNMIARSNAIVNELQMNWIKKNPCPGCRAQFNNVHTASCAYEECPFCHNSLSTCFCAYKKLNIRYGGQSKRDWNKWQKEEGTSFDPRKHARPLTPNEKRTWENMVFQKGCIPYGQETRFR